MQFCRVRGGGSTAVTAKLDCSHCRSTSLQLLILGGFNCSHCKVGLQSLQINFTAAQVQLPIPGGIRLHKLQSWTGVSAHFVQHHEISVPPSQSFRAKHGSATSNSNSQEHLCRGLVLPLPCRVTGYVKTSRLSPYRPRQSHSIANTHHSQKP